MAQLSAASPARIRAVGAKTLGVLAVIGLVIAFSLSSTLVKRAESPGVLVAFWRMVTVSLVWNAVLWSTGRRVTMANVRQALVPGVFFGLNLAVFFAGATHNSVANAALIGSLAPFLIVPVGRVVVHGVHRPARAGVRGPRVRRRGDRAVQRATEWRRIAGGQRVRPARDAAAGRLRRVDQALPAGHGRHHLHGDDLPDRGGGGAAAGARPRRRVRHERHGLDLHADPDASPAASRRRG